MAPVQRRLASSNPGRPRQRRDGFLVAVGQKEGAAECPQVERAARHGPAAGGDSQVAKSQVEISGRERRAGCVLVEHIAEHAELDRLKRDVMSLPEPADLEVRQIELPEQHRLGGPVEGGTRREAPPSVPGSQPGRARGHGLAQHLLGVGNGLAGPHWETVACRANDDARSRQVGAPPAPCYELGASRKGLAPPSLLTMRMLKLAIALSLVLVGCGRKATQADCDLILDHYVETQLRAMSITDPATIDKRKAEMRADMKDEVRDCVGKRVTDGMLACVKSAQTNAEIDKCTH